MRAGRTADPVARQHTERIIGAQRRLEAHRPVPEGCPIDGEGIQLSVDLDVALMEAGIRPEDADGLADDAVRALLARRSPQHHNGGGPESSGEPNPNAPRGRASAA